MSAETNNRILIIDDEPVVLRVLSEFLATEGFHTETALNGEQGIEIIKKNKIDLVLLDKNLPHTNWSLVVEMIREQDDSIAIIIISGYPSLDSVIEAINLNIPRFLMKPFPDLDQVSRTIRRVIDHNRIRKELSQKLRNLKNSKIRTKELSRESNLKAEDEDLPISPNELSQWNELINRNKEFDMEQDYTKTTDKPGQGMYQILVVDDEDVVLEVMKEFLGNEGYDVALAHSGEEALKLLKETKIPLLIADKNLPGISGLDLIMKAKEIDQDIKTMIITGYASLESALASMELGVCYYIKKPFDDLRQIRDKVQTALEQYKEWIELKKNFNDLAKDQDKLENRLKKLQADKLIS